MVWDCQSYNKTGLRPKKSVFALVWYAVVYWSWSCRFDVVS